MACDDQVDQVDQVGQVDQASPRFDVHLSARFHHQIVLDLRKLAISTYTQEVFVIRKKLYAKDLNFAKLVYMASSGKADILLNYFSGPYFSFEYKFMGINILLKNNSLINLIANREYKKWAPQFRTRLYVPTYIFIERAWIKM